MGRAVIISEDRMGEQSGILLKLEAFAVFYRESRRPCVLIQLINTTPPDPVYQSRVEQRVAEINSEFPGLVQLMLEPLPFEDRFAYFAIASVYLNTVIRLGLDLAPLEYVISRGESSAVVISGDFHFAILSVQNSPARAVQCVERVSSTPFQYLRLRTALRDH